MLYLIILTSVLPCAAYITRLPCKRHANFTIMKPDIRHTGTVLETHADVIARDCALLCLSRDSCVYFNHKSDNTSCELLASNSGTEQGVSGWKFYSTNYGTQNRGPVCRSLSPCHYKSACIDICEDPGYQCLADQFQGMYGTPYLYPGENAPYVAFHLTDFKSSTFAMTSADPNSFISLDLGAEMLIRFVTVSVYAGEHLQLNVGNTNHNTGNSFCSLVPYFANVKMVVECADYLSGRYVVLHQTGGSYVACYDMKAYIDV